MLISGAVGPGDHELDKSSLWLVSILGGAPRRLRGEVHQATLSPDDSLVVYMSRRGIWLAEADGENPREFIGPVDRESLGSPAWSSDGKRVIYRRVDWLERSRTIESRDLNKETSAVLVREENSWSGTGGVWAMGASYCACFPALPHALPRPGGTRLSTPRQDGHRYPVWPGLLWKSEIPSQYGLGRPKHRDQAGRGQDPARQLHGIRLGFLMMRLALGPTENPLGAKVLPMSPE